MTRGGVLLALALFACTRENSSGSLDMAGPRADEKCFPGGACGAGGSYQLCAVMSGPCTARYLTSDGASFQCASCSDCQAALANVARWCGVATTTSGITTGGPTTGGTTTMTGTTTSGTTMSGTTTSGTTAGTTTAGTTSGGNSCAQLAADPCFKCCRDAHPTGRTYFYSKYTPCICDASRCGAYCANDFCSTAPDAGATSPLCGFCAQMQELPGAACEPRAQCATNGECNAWLDCVNACPAN